MQNWPEVHREKHFLLLGQKRRWFQNVEKAFALLQTGSINYLVVDGCFLGQGLLPAMEFLKESYPRVPILVFSYDEDLQLVRKAMVSGATGYFGKEADTYDMFNQLQTVIGQKYLLACYPGLEMKIGSRGA